MAFAPQASQTFAPTMTYQQGTASRPRSAQRTLSRPLSRAGLSQTQTPESFSRVSSRNGSRQGIRRHNTNQPHQQRYYDQTVQGMDLSGWGEITPKPFSYEVEAYRQTGSYADPKQIRPAGGYGTQQWSPPPLRNTTSVGLVLRDTHTLHSQGSGVMVETVLPNSPAAWKGFRTKDVITHLNGRPCMTAQEFYDVYAQTQPHAEMEMALNRDGRRGMKFRVEPNRL